MRLKLDVITHDRRLGDKIVGGDIWAKRAPIEIAGGATLKFIESTLTKAFGIPETLQFIVDTSINVDVSLLAAWLYDKFRDQSIEQVVISRRTITRITKDELYQVIEEEIRRG